MADSMLNNRYIVLLLFSPRLFVLALWLYHPRAREEAKAITRAMVKRD